MRAVKKKLWPKLLCELITGIALGVILALTLGFVFMSIPSSYRCFHFLSTFFNSPTDDACAFLGASLGILLGSIFGVYWIYRTTKHYKKIALGSLISIFIITLSIFLNSQYYSYAEFTPFILIPIFFTFIMSLVKYALIITLLTIFFLHRKELFMKK